MDNKELATLCVNLADSLAQLDAIIEKLSILSNDFTMNYLEKIDCTSQELIIESNLNIVKVMVDVICDYSHQAEKISAPLPKLMENILEHIKVSG